MILSPDWKSSCKLRKVPPASLLLIFTFQNHILILHWVPCIFVHILAAVKQYKFSPKEFGWVCSGSERGGGRRSKLIFQRVTKKTTPLSPASYSHPPDVSTSLVSQRRGQKSESGRLSQLQKEPRKKQKQTLRQPKVEKQAPTPQPPPVQDSQSDLFPKTSSSVSPTTNICMFYLHIIYRFLLCISAFFFRHHLCHPCRKEDYYCLLFLILIILLPHREVLKKLQVLLQIQTNMYIKTEIKLCWVRTSLWRTTKRSFISCFAEKRMNMRKHWKSSK